MMGLVGDALDAATRLKRKFPNAIIVSGLRTVADQARAMAQNAAIERNWIRNTYLSSNASEACQSWIFSHPAAKFPELEVAFNSILHGFSANELGKLSKHLSGEAFDVLPIAGRVGLPIKNEMRALAGEYGGKFLEKEGSLTRWHWQAGEKTHAKS